jgi:tetratricopeptide (TPR) repeat protein
MQDRFGQDLTCANQDAAAAYIEGVDLMLTAWPGAVKHLDRALTADPQFALAHIARARALQMQAKPAAAAKAVSAARKQQARLDDRERSHVEILALAIKGDGAAALDALKVHIGNWPRDALVLSLITGVYGLMGFSGIADHHQQQRDLLDHIAPQWDDDWWFIAYRGWAHVETGDPGFGAPLLERSLAQRAANGNAAHGRAHAFYELGDTGAGAQFLKQWLPAYDENAALLPHLSWHLALFALRQGDAIFAEKLYAERLDPALNRQSPFFTVVDAGAFNWRTMLPGVHRTKRDLETVSAFASENFAHGGIGFANVHVAYAHAARGDRPALTKHLQVTKDNAIKSVHPSAQVVHSICCGISCFSDEDYAGAAEYLESALPELPRIGGSHAQRDGIWETLVSACLRSGREDKAKTLLERRLGLQAIFDPA